MNKLEMSGLVKKYGDLTAVNGVDLSVREGELLAILGPSGCGKSTLLSLIAGISDADSGSITLDGKVLFNSAEGINVPPEKRNIGFVFQDYALWPHMTVEQNICYPLKIRRKKRAFIKSELNRILKLIRLEHKRACYPGQLSGGERQRVALGRALIMNPRLLLLDEPLSSLDASLRVNMQSEIRSIQKEFGLTVIHVTHDQAEAMAMADRIAVLNKGKLEQIGEPAHIYEQPATAFTADFMGTNNLLRGSMEQSGGKCFFRNSRKLCLEIPNGKDNYRGRGLCLIRPEDIGVNKHNESIDSRTFEGIIINRIYKGTHYLYTVKAGSEILTVRTHSSDCFDSGSVVRCAVKRCRFLSD